MAEIRTGRGQGPQVEKLRDTDKLQSSVSPQAIRNYDEKRPDYVERPHWGDGKWAQLAQALSQYSPALDGMAVVEEERFRERNLALSKRLHNDNKVSWKEFVEANPQYRGLNPHLERGYKAAHLATKAQDFKAAAYGNYTTSGLITETDPEKVRAGIDDFSKKWAADNITQEDLEDAEIYEENFYRGAVETQANIMKQHASDKAVEHLRRAKDKFSTLLTQDMDTFLAGTDGSPEGFSAATDSTAAQWSVRRDEMKAIGMQESEIDELMGNVILQNARALGGENGSALGPRALKLLDKVQTANGPLSANAAIRAKSADQMKAWRDDQRAEQSHNARMEEHNRQRAHWAATDKASGIIKKNRAEGRDTTLEELTAALPASQADVAILWHKRGQVMAQPEFGSKEHREYQQYLNMAYSGLLSPTAVDGLYGKFPDEQMEKLMAVSRSIIGGDNDPTTKVLTSPTAREGRDFIDAQLEVQHPGDEEESAVLRKAKQTSAKALYNAEMGKASRQYLEQTGHAMPEEDLYILSEKKKVEIIRLFADQKQEADTPAIIMTADESRAKFDPVGPQPREPKWGPTSDAAAVEAARADIAAVINNFQEHGPRMANKLNIPLEQLPDVIDWYLHAYGIDPEQLDPDYERRRELDEYLIPHAGTY